MILSDRIIFDQGACKLILMFGVEAVRRMIGMLMCFQTNHQQNAFVEPLFDHVIEQFVDFEKKDALT